MRRSRSSMAASSPSLARRARSSSSSSTLLATRRLGAGLSAWSECSLLGMTSLLPDSQDVRQVKSGYLGRRDPVGAHVRTSTGPGPIAFPRTCSFYVPCVIHGVREPSSGAPPVSMPGGMCATRSGDHIHKSQLEGVDGVLVGNDPVFTPDRPRRI